MNPSAKNSRAGDDEAIRDVAARWVVRQDRGLSAGEKRELEAWLAADPRHGEVLERSVGSWRKFRELGAAVRRAPETAGASRSRWSWSVASGLAAAAAFALGYVLLERPPRNLPDERVVAMSAPAEVTTRRLPDGSMVRLKAGAEIVDAFSATERRVRLVRGEVFFTVEKDAARPFLVEVGNVTVRAVGTAFAVRREAHAIDVLVTEGTVQVTPQRAGETDSGGREVASEAGQALVGAGHRAVVAQGIAPKAAAVVISPVSAAEIARSLAWNAPMLEFAGATLGELVGAFAERSGQRIEVNDAALRGVRIGGQFPTNDLDGFLRALAEIYDVKVERRPDGVIVLRRAK